MSYYGMERAFYEQLSHWKAQSHRKPLVLRGARQVGKTYGIKTWGARAFRKVVELNFEKDKNLIELFRSSLDPKTLLNKIINYFNIEIDFHLDLLFFDEIQICGQALNSLKYFNEEMPELAIIAAGSLLGLVLNNEPFPVGKVEFLDVYPMSFREFLHVQKKDFLLNEALENNLYLDDKLVEQLKHYLITGGCPEIISLYLTEKPQNGTQFQFIRKRQEDLINSHLADMAKHCGKLNAMSLERFWRNIPEQLSRETKHVSRFIFKDVLPKKNKYSQMTDIIDWLQTAGLIHRIQIVNQGKSPLSAYAKESLFKLYLYDVGILNALSNLSPTEILSYDFGSFKGYLLENFALQQLVTLFGKHNFSWNEGSAEVDFIREINGQIIPIEVKAGINLKAKSLLQYISKYSPAKAYRFSLQKVKTRLPQSLIKDYPIYLVGEIKIWE